jgi:hypothetical protein
MFIELTDHLRCPAEHDEAFLVLLPDLAEGRSVRKGTLGCPICDRRFTLRDGVFDAGDGPAPAPADATRLGPEAVAALIGLGGPGGYLVLVGAPGGQWREQAGLMPGVGLVAVNPPAGVEDEDGVSVIRAGRLPLKKSSMRGVVLGAPYGGDEAWVREAARVALPGLRVAAEGPDPDPAVIELMASADGVWVGTGRR